MIRKYFGYMPNDFINGEGVSVSLWVAGCPLRCPGCHNSHMWNYEDGYPVPKNLKEKLIEAIKQNGITRNFSVLGGEPLANYNLDFVLEILTAIRKAYPSIKIYLWTGYTSDEIRKMEDKDKRIHKILSFVNVLVTGRFELNKRDITLELRGSSNQEIWYLN